MIKSDLYISPKLNKFNATELGTQTSLNEHVLR